MNNQPRINPQPFLGRYSDNYKPHLDSNQLFLAKVIAVHHKNNTVDLQIVKTNDIISSSENSEGRFGARVATSSAHFNGNSLTSSGVVEPMQEGQLVILAFLYGFKSEPIVLGSFHNIWETTSNVLTDRYPLKPESSLEHLREALKYLRVTPSQLYHKIDGVGAVEFSHPSKTFMVLDPDFDEEVSDSHKSFDHNNLSEIDPVTGEVRSAKTEETLFPVKFMLSHRSSFEDEDTTWTKLFIDRTGEFRLTRDTNDDRLFYINLKENGDFLLRKQMDSSSHGEGKDFTELSINDKGSLDISRVKDNRETKVSIGDNGEIVLRRDDGTVTSITITDTNEVLLNQSSGSTVSLTNSGDISLNAKNNLILKAGGRVIIDENGN